MFKLFVFCLLIAIAYGAVSTINTNLRAYNTRPVIIAGGWEGGRGIGGWDGGRGIGGGGIGLGRGIGIGLGGGWGLGKGDLID